MQRFRVLLAVAIATGIGLVAVLPGVSQKTAQNAGAQSGALLSGTIRSAAGQSQEGITVSARAEGSTITITTTGSEGSAHVSYRITGQHSTSAPEAATPMSPLLVSWTYWRCPSKSMAMTEA